MITSKPVVIEFSSYPAPALRSTRPTKHSLPWEKFSDHLMKHVRSATKDINGWSPAIYKEGHTRGNDVVLYVSCAVGDFDHVSYDDLAEQKERLTELGLTYALYSTYSCTPDDVCYRIVIPFSTVVVHNDWPEAWHRINWHVFRGKNDQQTKDQSRFFYVPSAPHDALVFAEQQEGSSLDPTTLPPAPVPSPEEHHVPLDHTAILDGIPEGERDGTLMRYASDMRGKDVPIETALLAISEAARRCVPPFDIKVAESKVYNAYRKYTPNPKFGSDLTKKPATAADLDAVPAFPLDVLPESFQRYVERTARLKVCPPEYVAVPLLVAAGTTMGNVVKLRLNSTWIESTNLFAALIGDPGSKKTPAIQQALRPANRLQSRLSAAYKKERETYDADLKYWEDFKPKEDRGPRPTEPVYKHVTVSDVTIEKLADVLMTSKGVVLAIDELAGWVRGMDQYRGGKGSDRQHFLSLWSSTTIKVDRKNSPVPILVESPCLGVVGGIQPEMLPELADSKNRSDGFLDRILWCYPDAIPDHWVDDDGEDDGIEALDDLFSSMYEVYGTSDLLGNHIPMIAELSAEALIIWKFWYEEHARDRDNPAFPKNLAGPWAKMGSQLARIALILHLIHEEKTNFISAQTIGDAVRVIEYFKAHTRKVFAELSEQRTGNDLKILEALKAGEMKQMDIRVRVFQGHISAAKVQAILSELEELGLVQQRKQETSGRTSTIWSLT